MRRRVNCSTDSFLALLVVVVLLISGQHPLLAVHNKATTSATTSTSQLSNPAVPRDSLRPPLPLPLPPSSSTSSSSSSPLLHAHIAASGTKKYAHDDAKESNHTKSRLTTFLTGIWNSILSMAELNVHLHENAYGQVDSSRYPVSRSSGVSRLLVNHNINPISSSGKDDDIKSKVGAQSTTSSSTQNHYKLKSPRPSRARQNSRGEPDETVAAQPNVGGTTSPSFLRRTPTIRSNLKSLSTLRLQQGKIDAGAAQAFTLSRKGEKKKALDQEKDDKTGVSLPLAIPNTETSTTKKVSSSKVHVAPVFALEAATAMRNKLYSQALRAIKDQIYADHILTSQEDVIGIAKRYYLEPYTKILRECGFIPWSEYEAAENRHGIIGLAGQNLNDIVLQKFSSMYRSPASSSGSESEMTSIDEFGNTALINNNNNNNKITTSNLAKTLISKHTLQPEIFALSALSLALEQKHISTPRRTAIRLISQLLNLSDKETSDLSSLTNDMRSLVFTNTHELGSISSSSNNNEEDMIFDMEV